VDTRVGTGSPLYLLERSDVGLVQLDRDLRVVAMNSFARRVLPVEDKQPFQKVVLSFHPERSQAKVKFLIDQAECPVSNPPPMTMIINIPERVLLVKVSKMADERDVPAFVIFSDVSLREMALSTPPPTAAPAAPAAAAPRARPPRKVAKAAKPASAPDTAASAASEPLVAARRTFEPPPDVQPPLPVPEPASKSCAD